MQQTRSRSLVALAFLALPVLGGAQPGDSDAATDASVWPQWRGPTRDGQTPGRPWGADLSAQHLAETWRVDGLGPSYSGPVADAERVYTTETVDEKLEVVRALSRATGEELWRTEWTGAMEVPFFAARNGSWIRSTPALDEAALYVAGIRDVLTCLDAQTGETRWSVNFMARFETELPPFGCVPSPLLTESHVYIQAGAALVKIDKATGETVWRTMVEEGDMMSAGAFSSPVLAELNGQPQLVVQSRVELAGIALDDGSLLWSTPVRAFRGMNILTPTIVGNGVFTTAHGGSAQLIEIAEHEGQLEVGRRWDTNVQGYMTSPVIVDGHAYLFLKSNRFGCVDLESGEKLWTSPPTGDSYWSLAAQGDRILALSDTGILRLIRANPAAYEVLSEREVTASETWAHVAPAGRQLFVRSQDSLIALSWK